MSERENKLFELAVRELGPLSEAETAFFQSVARSSAIDCSKGGDKNPANENKWGPERTIRATSIAWLCTYAEASSFISSQTGIAIIGARITGQLRLPYTRVHFPLMFVDCSIPNGFYMRGADIAELILDGSHVGSLVAGNMRVAGNIHLHRATIRGMVDLSGAKIIGNVACNGGHFSNKETPALNADKIEIFGDLQMNYGFTSEGVVNVKGARIRGDLQCVKAHFINKNGPTLIGQQMEVKGSLLMDEVISEGTLDFRGAKIDGYFEAQGASFQNGNDIALALEAARIGGPLFLDGAKANGEVSLANSAVDGHIQLDGGTFVNTGKVAIFAQQLKVHGNCLLRDLNVTGEVNFAGSTIDGILECDRSRFSNSGGKALNAEHLNAAGLHLHENFTAEGEIRLLNAVLEGDLYCSGGHFLNEKHIAIQAEHIKIGGKAFLGTLEVNGRVSFALAEIRNHFKWTDVMLREGVTLDLRHSRMGTLWDDEKSWPQQDHLWINGLIYEDLDSRSPRSTDSRIRWIKLQPRQRFYPQPYDQLASVYEKSAQDQNAKEILIEKNNNAVWISQMALGERIRHRFLGVTIDYGYGPFKALYWILFFILFSTATFHVADKAHIMTPSKDGAYVSTLGKEGQKLTDDYPKFNSLFYSIDLFIPVIDLHMKNYWLPNANKKGKWRITDEVSIPINGNVIRGWFWCHIILGWVFITIFIVGLTGLVKK